jgi:hypothetical protein
MRLDRTTDNRKSKVSRDYCPPLVISVHGIRTHGEWQKTFASAMSGFRARTEAFEYGDYGLFRFLIPPFNGRLVDRFYNWFGMVTRNSPNVDLSRFDRRPSIVAHSLGSWIVGNAMLKHEDLRFDKIIFAGSILPRDFDWATLFARDQVSFVRNECGQRDPWPGWAGRLVARTGTGGSKGFEWFSSVVENVPCDWFGHSDALIRQHIEQHWIPVLLRRPSPLILLHGRDIHDLSRFSRILDYCGNVIDTEVYGKLSFYPEAAIPRGLSLNWIRINPDIYTFLMDSQSDAPAAYINAMPIDDGAYAEIRSGKRDDNTVTAEDVVPYVMSNTVKVYLMSIAVAEKHRRWGEGFLQTSYVQLLTGFIDKLIWYAKRHHVRVTHILASAWTPEGRRICQSFAMTQVGMHRFGDAIFELDLEALRRGPATKVPSAFRSLLKVYSQM